MLCAVLQGKACSPGVELASSRRGKTPTPAIMLIPKKNRKEVYKYLFKGEGRFLDMQAALLCCYSVLGAVCAGCGSRRPVQCARNC